MDPKVVETLEKAGFDVQMEKSIPTLPIGLSEDEKVVRAVGPEVVLLNGETPFSVTLKSIPELFTGSVVPPSFAKGPTKEYLKFFAAIEMTALEYFHAAGPERDEEFVRLYNLLRRRPDGTDPNPLFSYLQGAVRLYMSLRDVSQAEFEAVLNRLTRSARAAMEGAASRNYIALLHRQLHPGH